ncbi:MAG TPA: MG2 domain-containing protein [Humisphaera sp.]|jgi:hypothetical protein|nr:MG2 domain-containing protein [Humisphaera sp.]
MSANAPASSAGSRRFWIALFIFAVANLAAWVGFARWQQQRNRLLAVEQFWPGEAAQVDGRAVLTWMFNLDVEAPPAGAAPPIRVAPAIAGSWKWTDRRTLIFMPDAALPPATAFVATMPADALHTPQGLRLARARSFAFHTQPQSVVAIRQAGVDENNRVILELQFSDAAQPDDVERHLALLGPHKEPIKFHPHGNAAGATIRVMTDSVAPILSHPEAAYIDVTIRHGLGAGSGPLSLTQDVTQRIQIGSDVIATGAEAYSPGKGDPTIQLTFNNEVDLPALKEILSIEPAIPFSLSSAYNGVTLHGNFEPGTRYVLKVAKPPTYSTAKRIPRPTTLGVLVPDRTPAIWFEHPEGYLSSAGNKLLLAHAVNYTDVRINVSRVYDSNLVAWRNAVDRQRWTETQSFGRPIASRDVHLSAVKNQPQELRIALNELLAKDSLDGVYQVTIMATRPGTVSPRHRLHHEDEPDESFDASATTLVTLSDIGLTAKSGREGVLVWAASLRSGKPLPAARVRLFSNKNQPLGEATTDADGLARISEVHPAPGEKPQVLIADFQSESSGDQATEDHSASHGLTWLDLKSSELATGDLQIGGRPYLREGFEAFVYTDRGVYRPGETVHLRAIIRGQDQTTPPEFPVRWQLRRPDLRDWKSEMRQIDADGAASMDLQLPEDLPTGRWTADIGLPSSQNESAKAFGSATFLVEEFMPQRMKVSASFGAIAENQRIDASKDALPIDVQADYLFGRPAEGRHATVIARIDPATFAPSAFKGWTFGDSADAAGPLGRQVPLGKRKELDGADLDAKGHAHWDLDLDDLIENGPATGDAPKPTARRSRKDAGSANAQTSESHQDFVGPWTLTVNASVLETGGRAVTAMRQAQVDRAPYYVGLRLGAASPQPGIASGYELKLITPAGAISQNDLLIEARLYRESWNTSYVYEEKHYRYQSTRVLEAVDAEPRHIAIHAGAGEGSFTLPSSGSFVLVLRDPATGGMTSHRISAYFGSWEDNISRENPEHLQVILQHPGQQSEAGNDASLRFEIGKPAEVVVLSPFAGQLLLAIETDGVVSTKVLEMTDSQIVVPIDVTEACRPNAYVTATVIRGVNPNEKWRAHRAFGTARLTVEENDRRLEVQLAAPKEIRPSSSLHVDLRVADNSGAPVANAAVTLAAVDEGICALTRFATPDPLAFFTATRALQVRWADLYGELMPEAQGPLRQSDIGGDESAAMSHRSPVSAKRVRPVALVSGVLHTDAQGVAHADFTVPQFTGQLRLMAVASADKRFGSAEDSVFVRSPILVQSSWPRFAAPGDRFSVPLVVFNNQAKAGNASITIELNDGPLKFAAATERSLTLSPLSMRANGQAETSFNIVADQRIGVAHARLIARLDDETYEESIELPIRPASPAIALGGYAIAKPGAPAVLQSPQQMVEGTGHFELRISPKPQLQVPTGLDYLDRYPYGCLEQTTSTLFPLVYLPDIGKDLAPGMFDHDRVADKIRVGILRLISMQTADGGLAMWPGGSQSWPWGSIYAAHFLLEAKAAGFEVPEEFTQQMLGYVRAILSRPQETEDVLETQAYAAYVLAQAGKPQRAVMQHLGERFGALPSNPGRFHLAMAWLASGRKDLADGLIPKAIPQPRPTRELAGALASPIRDRALYISTLLAAQPQNPAIPDLVQRLARDGADHQWRSTQDVSFALMAIGRYLRQSGSSAACDKVELLANAKLMATADGATPLLWTAPPDLLHGPLSVEAVATGAPDSAAHISWLQWGVPMQPPAPSDQGIEIRRRYLNERGEPLNLAAVRSGDLVQIEIALRAGEALSNIVIDDLLPAGLEIENPRLENHSAGMVKRDETPHDPNNLDFRPARIDMRDDRLILVGDIHEAGRAVYTYTARAVAPGRFVVPPIQAQCMYDLAISSVSGGGMMNVISPGAPIVAGAEAGE